MLSKALLRLGASAARHPWRVIAAWLVAATLAVLAAVAFGGRTADTMTAPGLDSQRAAELIERAGTGQEGMTAQVVVTPSTTVRRSSTTTARAPLSRGCGPR